LNCERLQEKMMLKFLLVSPDKEALSDLASALIEHDDVALSWAKSGEVALDMALNTDIDLIITDEGLGDMTGLVFASRLLAVNPMINCATISRLSPEKFHEESEGLGLMAQLPVHPGHEHAKSLLQRLKYIKNLTSGVNE